MAENLGENPDGPDDLDGPDGPDELGRSEIERVVGHIRRHYGQLPGIFTPALSSSSLLGALWSPLRSLSSGALPKRFLHSLLALLFHRRGTPYGAVWHLVALAAEDPERASLRELLKVGAEVDAGELRTDVLETYDTSRGRGRGRGEDPLERPELSRGLLCLCLMSVGSTDTAALRRRQLRRIFGLQRYLAWTEAVMHVQSWADWLHSFPEVKVKDEAWLAEPFAKLCAEEQLHGLADFAGLNRDLAEEVVREPSARWRIDADAVHTGILQTDLSGNFIVANAAARRIFQLSKEEVEGFCVADFSGKIFREDGSLCPVREFPLSRCLETLTPQGPYTLGYQDVGRRRIWAQYTATPTLDPLSDEVVGVTVTVVDMTDRKRKDAVRQASEDRYRLIAEASDSMIVLICPKGTIVTANDAAAAYIGLSADELTGKTLHELIREPSLVEAYMNRNAQVIATGEGMDLEEMVEIGNECRWISMRLRPVRNLDGAIYAVQALIRDISPRRQAEVALREREEQARHESLHDPLTRQPNRVLLRDRLEVEVLHAKRHPDYRFAVLCLDLDRFKNINDSLGHTVGDQLLIQFSRRLRETIGPEDTLARTGGDEFAILVKDLGDPTEVLKLAERVLGILQRPFSVGEHQIYTPTSIGIALSSAEYAKPEDILRDADTAMFRAKSRGKNRFEIFDKGMHREAVDLLVLENDLRRAISRREFCLYYQPVVELRNGDLAGFEALLRWKHPTRGLVSPGEFIAFAEETGIIIAIGEWVLQEACQQMQRWHTRYPLDPELTISVNLSGKQFAQPALIAKALQETALNPASLKLEITESVIMEDPRAASTLLQELQGQQIQSYVDDFGTGYSSLSYLHRFPMSAVKIDRSFISGMGSAGENSEIVRTIVSLAHNLGMKVIAEGVETDDQRRLLVEMGCEYAQGYFFSRPLEKLNAEALIAATFSQGERSRSAHAPGA